MMHDTISPASNQVVILAHYRDRAIAKLEKVARRAAKYGQSITWTERSFVERVERVLWDGETKKLDVQKIEFDIVGSAPKVGDYVFLASLEQMPGGVIVSSVSGVEIGDLGFNWRGECQHCGSNRQRKQAYVVEGPEGRKVVGKSCLRDYLGTDVPAGLLSTFTFEEVSAMGRDEDGCYGGYGRWEESTLGVIATARAAIALWGWRPSSHEGMTTASYANLLFETPMRDSRGRDPWAAERQALRAELKERGEHYYEEADKVLAWGRELEGRSDYERNLKVALAGDVVVSKTFRLVVSACAAFDRQVAREDEARKAREAEEARLASVPPSRHIGAPGERLSRTVTLERVIGLPDYGYGPSVILAMRADDGALVSWKTAYVPNVNGKPVEANERFEATFTVKAHSEFKGTPETRVLRCKLAPVA